MRKKRHLPNRTNHRRLLLNRMKLLQPILSILCTIMLTSTTLASDIPFYLGTYTNTPPSQGIYLGTLNTNTGALGTLTLAGTIKNPSFVALSPNRRFLYAVAESPEGSVTAFRIEADGKLSLLNTQSSEGAAPCHLTVDSSGKNVLVANYNGGNVIVFPVQADGSLGVRTAIVPYTGTSIHPQRQNKPHAHSIYPSTDNRFVYSCDLGTDSIWSFRFDPAQGTLTPTEPPAAKVAPGAGPRHLAFSADGSFVYVINEMNLTVTTFARDAKTGALTELQTVTTMPEGAPREGVSTAAIVLHPNGRWLYASNRGHDSITIYAVGNDGKLTWIDNTPAQVKIPRCFAIDPTGQWIIATGQNDSAIAVLRIAPATGKLSSTDHKAAVGTPVCVVFGQP